MVNERWYFLLLNPEPWKMPPLSVTRIGGKIIPMTGRDQQLHAYKEAVKEELRACEPDLMEGKLILHIWFWRCKKVYKTTKGKMHRKHTADSTNMFKSTEDACQGVLFKNDNQNVETHGYIVNQGNDVLPLIVIYIRQADDLILSAQNKMLSMMNPKLREVFTGTYLSSTNTELPEDDDDDWEPGEF